MGASPGRIAFAWIIVIAVLITLAIMQIAVDPQVEMWQSILEQFNIHPEVGEWLIGIYRLSLVICAVGIVIWGVINVLSSEDDTYQGGF